MNTLPTTVVSVIWRWLLRVMLILGAYFLGSFGSFFLLMAVTWDQAVVDVVGIIAGVASSAFAFYKSQALTQPKRTDP